MAVAQRDRPRQVRSPTLTGRASLNAIASLIDYGAKLGVGFVVTPIIVAGLGSSLYGAWEMLNRLVTYLASADGRPTEALRLVVASRQGDDDADAQRRAVGATFVVWLIFLPLLIGLGAVLIWIAPILTHAPPELRSLVRITTGLLIVGLITTLLAEVPESVLHGMNISYRQVGLQASLNLAGGMLMVAAVRGGLLLMGLVAGLSIMGGFLTVAAIQQGLGLIGLAATQLVLAIVAGAMFLALVRRHVPWFGITRPRRADVRSLLSMSAWLTLGDLVTKALLASDVVILGTVLAPAVVTAYALTGYAARTAMGVHVLVTSAAMPGLGDLIGRGSLARVAELRRELQTLTWLFVASVGATILAWNRSFLSLWVGTQHYAGGWVELLIVLLVVQTAFIRSDAYIIDAALQPRSRVITAVAAAGLSIALAVPLTFAFHTVGLCLGLLLGRAIQSIVYPRLVRTFLGVSGREDLRQRRDMIRLVLVLGAILAGGEWLGRALTVSSWPAWAGGAALTAGVALAIALALGLPKDDRLMVLARVQTLLGKERRP